MILGSGILKYQNPAGLIIGRKVESVNHVTNFQSCVTHFDNKVFTFTVQ